MRRSANVQTLEITVNVKPCRYILLMSIVVMLFLAIYVLSNPMPFKGEFSCETLALLGQVEHRMG